MKAPFTVLTVTEPKHPGKSYWLDQGELRSCTEGRYGSGKARTVEAASAEQLREAWEGLTANDCILQGVASLPEVVVRAGASEQDQGAAGAPAVARSDKSFPRPSAPGIMVIDTDQEATIAEVLRQLHEACPALQAVSCAQATSTGAMILDSATGEVLKGTTGTHTIYLVRDASDVPRALEMLHKRLWLAGHSWIKLAGTGNMMVRSAVDLAMSVSSQPLYVRAHLGEGLEQRKVFEVYSNSDTSDFLDTRAALPDLSADEARRVEALMLEAQREMQPPANEKRREYERARLAELESQGMTTKDALALICTALGSRDLYADFRITLSGSEQITVQDILDDPARYHGMSCRDPLEPDYGSNTVATIYSDQSKPIIKSHAHGGRKFFLHAGMPPDDPAEPMPGEAFDIKAGEVSTPPRGYKLLTSRDVRALPPLRWRIKGVLPEQGVAAIFGQSASGKSFLAFDMAVAIAGGDEWFGCRVNSAPVVYVCLEGEAGFGQRVKAWEVDNLRKLPDALNMVLEPIKITKAGDVE